MVYDSYETPFYLPCLYPPCFRGCTESGSLIHIFWSCKHLKPICQEAASKVSTIAGRLITLTVQMCLCFTPIPVVPIPCVKRIHTLFIAIHWVTALNWRTSAFSWSQVLARMDAIKLSERVYHTLYDTMHIQENKSKHLNNVLL